MTVTSVDRDLQRRTLTIAARYSAPVERVWRVWADPRQLERWWGPPTYPATVLDHDLVPGGRVTYYMTGPDGDRSRGWWRVVEVLAPHSLEFEDGFADADGVPDESMPTTLTRVTLAGTADGGTDMTVMSVFPSVAAMEKMVAMGVVEGLTAALGQVDDLLSADVSG